MIKLHLDNLAKAVKLQAELKQWQELLSRCKHGVFKAGAIRVSSGGHGHQGQSAETIIEMTAENIKPIAEAHVARLQSDLRALGVEL